MITYKLKTPITVGDIKNQIVVDELAVKSISLTFMAKEPVISIVFLHPASDWQHNVCYAHWNTGGTPGEPSGKEKITAASDLVWNELSNELKKVIDTLVQLMIKHGDVPPCS